MNLFCVRAEFGSYTKQFLDGNYAGIGWLPKNDLSKVNLRDEIYPLYKKEYPNDTSNVVVGQQVGQIARFLLDIKPSDYIILPDSNTDIIYYGEVLENPYYYVTSLPDSCPYNHRIKVKWNQASVRRASFSVPFQNSIRSSLTVFKVNHLNHFLTVIGKSNLVTNVAQIEKNYYSLVLDMILKLDATEFEVLITHILTALGFEGSEHTGKVRDGGVDATGELNIANLAKIKLFVQAKRYKLGTKVLSKDIKDLRSNIPVGGQGAFITTADFKSDAIEIATEAGFPRIGLINGHQLVDILTEHWEDIPVEFQQKIGLKLGLVIAD